MRILLVTPDDHLSVALSLHPGEHSVTTFRSLAEIDVDSLAWYDAIVIEERDPDGDLVSVIHKRRHRSSECLIILDDDGAAPDDATVLRRPFPVEAVTEFFEDVAARRAAARAERRSPQPGGFVNRLRRDR